MSYLGRMPPSQTSTSIPDLVAEIVVDTFSFASFEKYFGTYPLPDAWSRDDALGVWYSLGSLSLAVAVWSVFNSDPAKSHACIDSFRNKLLKRWNMSGTSLDRLFTFSNQTEAVAFKAIHSCDTGARLASFFQRYASNVVGMPVPISYQPPFDDQLAGVRFAKLDPISIASLSDEFFATCRASRELIAKV